MSSKKIEETLVACTSPTNINSETSLPERITNVCISFYRQSFREIHSKKFLLDNKTTHIGQGISIDPEEDELELEPVTVNSNGSSEASLESNANLNSSNGTNSSTIDMTFWDKTVCSGFSNTEKIFDSKLKEEFSNSTVYSIMAFFAWGFFYFANFLAGRLTGFEHRFDLVVLCLASIVPLRLSRKVPVYVYPCIILLLVVIDSCVAACILYLQLMVDHSSLCLIVDTFMLVNFLGSTLGFRFIPVVVAILLAYCNFALHLTFSLEGVFWFINVHAIGYSAYLGLGHILVQLLLLRNRNFQTPFFRTNKIDIYHKVRYLKVSGKLSLITLSPKVVTEPIASPKVKRRGNSNAKKSTVNKLKSSAQVPADEEMVLRPITGDIGDCFDMAVKYIGTNSALFGWTIPLNFISFISKDKNLIQGTEEVSSILTSALPVISAEDYESLPTDAEVIDRASFCIRINGKEWSSWEIIDSHTIYLDKLEPFTSYAITFTFLGFRSIPIHITTLPMIFEPTFNQLSDSNESEGKISSAVCLDGKLNDVRLAKKEKTTALKKLKKHIATLEATYTQNVQQAAKNLERAKHEMNKLDQSFKDLSISNNRHTKQLKDKEKQYSDFQFKTKCTEESVISTNYQFNCLKETVQGLIKRHDSVIDGMVHLLQNEVNKLQKAKNYNMDLIHKIYDQVQRTCMQVQQELTEVHQAISDKKRAIVHEQEQCEGIQRYREQLSSALTDKQLLKKGEDTTPVKTQLKILFSELDKHILSLNKELFKLEVSINKYEKEIESETEFVGRLQAEETKIQNMIDGFINSNELSSNSESSDLGL